MADLERDINIIKERGKEVQEEIGYLDVVLKGGQFVEEAPKNSMWVKIVPPGSKSRLMVIITTYPKSKSLENLLVRKITEDKKHINEAIEFIGATNLEVLSGSVVLKTDVNAGVEINHPFMLMMINHIINHRIMEFIPQEQHFHISVIVSNDRYTASGCQIGQMGADGKAMETTFMGSAPTRDLVPYTCLEDELRMVMVGKTGVGKSRTGNTIVGEKIFRSKVSVCSVTSECKHHTFKRDGQNIQLIDVPGFVDTNMSEAEIQSEVVKCVSLSHPGLHAILFLIEIGRFTEVDIKTLKHFSKCFGKDSIQYVIVIFTKVDSLKHEDMSLEEYLKTVPPLLRDLLNKTNNRYLGVNNWSDQKAEKETFVTELISMVKSLVKSNGGKCYTNEMYKLAEEYLQQGIKKEMERLAKEEMRRDEEKMRQAKEEFKMEFEEEKIKMERKHKAHKEEVERVAEENVKKEAEKRRQAEEVLKMKLEQQKLEQEEKHRQMEALKMEMVKRSEEDRARVEEEKRKAEEEFERKQKEERERMEREMKEKEEELRKEIEDERRATAIKNQRDDIEASSGFFDKIVHAVGGFFEEVKDWFEDLFD